MNVGSEETCTEIHRTLLGTGMVILENLDMSKAAPGQYVLVAAPLRMKGMDGSPVRAVLMEGENLHLTPKCETASASGNGRKFVLFDLSKKKTCENH